MGTPYTYLAPDGSHEVHEFRFGEAPRTHKGMPRVYDGSIHYTYGKDDFHGPTIGERFERQVADCAADGKGYEPVGQRWI